MNFFENGTQHITFQLAIFTNRMDYRMIKLCFSKLITHCNYNSKENRYKIDIRTKSCMKCLIIILKLSVTQNELETTLLVTFAQS